MGKILFKAKRKDNNEWIEGFYREWIIYDNSGNNKAMNYFIDQEHGESEVIYPKTVCQRLHDVFWYFEEGEGVEEQIEAAWQNDVIQICMSDGTKHTGFVDVEFGNLIFVSNFLSDGYIYLHELSEELTGETFEVVDGILYIRAKLLGNRFDNAELLGDNYESYF